MTDAAVDLAFSDQGDGSPVVILHGLFGSRRNWQTVARRLAADYRVVAVDLRNHGDSPHAEGMDYDTMAGDVARLLERLDLHDVALLGHSMGGKAALQLALTEPARLARLVIVDIAPIAYPDHYSAMIDAMQSVPLSPDTRRAEVNEYLKTVVPEDEIRVFLLQNLKVRADAAPEWRVNLEGIRRGLADIVAANPLPPGRRFDGPVDFILGERSDRFLPRHEGLVAPGFPRFKLHHVPAAGHWPHAENPSAFMEILEACLARR